MKGAIFRKQTLFLLLAAAFVLRCDIPGCGPGEVPRNPLSSNLVDFTVPATGSILRPSGFTKFKFYFLRTMDMMTFSVADDVRLLRIPEGLDRCEPLDVCQPVDAEGVFSRESWSGYGGSMTALLTLHVNASELAPSRYMIRLLKNGSTPLASGDGTERLEEDVDVYLKVVAEDSPRIWIDIGSSNIDEGIFHGFFIPHHHIKVTFRYPMGFINVVPEPLGGFYLRHIYEDGNLIGIESDSSVGLSPLREEFYQFDILSSDAAPNGLPWTMDIYGNLLGSCSGGECRYESYSRELRPSQARIIIPYHEAFSEEGADWFAQLRALGYHDEVFFLVEVTKDVDVLKSSGFGVFSSIPFPDRQITQIEKDESPMPDTVVVRVDVEPEDIPECQRLPDGNYTMELGHRQNLQVFAWGGGRLLGSDKILVDPLPEDFHPGVPSGYNYLKNFPEDDDQDISYIILESSSSGWPVMPINGIDSLQGGVFSEMGHLYLVNGYLGWGDIWVFNLNDSWTSSTGQLFYEARAIDRSGHDSFVFDCGGVGEEPEGIDIWDLSLDPRFQWPVGPLGQIHVIMIDNVPKNSDDWYFKHYQTTRPEDKCKI